MKSLILSLVLSTLVLSGFNTAGQGKSSPAKTELTFDSSGRPAKLVLGGKNMLESGSSKGFLLRVDKGQEVIETHLNKISTSGNTIKVSRTGEKPEFTLQIDAYEHHLAIHLLDAKGVGTGQGYSLSLTFDSENIDAYTLNDLMTCNADSRKRKGVNRDQLSGDRTVLSWPYLWGRPRPNGTHGSVVLFNKNLKGSERDAVLAEIWSVQGKAGHMVRPAGQETWTEKDVKDWVDQWVSKFSRIATVSVDATNLEELYKMTDAYAVKSGANRVYMWTSVWRESNQSMVAVNTNLFPKGKADLIAYSEYLANNGIDLQLKSLSPCIGEYDTKYISPDFIDERIMRTASGELFEDIAPTTTTIRFRPVEKFLNTKDDGYMRIGNELVYAEKITQNDDVWILENCERGFGASTAKSHKAGTEMAGCVFINGSFNFRDDFGMPNSIAEEICGEYGNFLNEVNVGHLHFDGTGRMGQYPWYVRDFTDYVYSKVDHPVTGSTVGGHVMANFEMEFSGAKAISGATAYHLMRIAPRLHERGRKHTELSPSMLDLHFDVSDGIVIGSRQLTFCGGQSGKALSLETLDNYGLTDYALQLFKNWVELAPVFDDADADYVAGFLQKGGNHYQGEDVVVLSKQENGDYIFTPHRVMGRTSGEDPFIHIDQEWGAVPRFQNIKPGTSMELFNPYEKQRPQVVIRVEHDSETLINPLIKLNGKGELAINGEINANEYMKFEGGNTVDVYDCNWNLIRNLPASTKSFVVNKGNNTITTLAGNNAVSDLRVQFITLGQVYVLESNKHLH